LHKTCGVPEIECMDGRRVIDSFAPGWLTVKAAAQSMFYHG